MSYRPVALGAAALIGTCLLAPSLAASPASASTGTPSSAVSPRSSIEAADPAWGIDLANGATVVVEDGATTISGTATAGEVTIVNNSFRRSTETVPVVDGRWTSKQDVSYSGNDHAVFGFTLRSTPGGQERAAETRIVSVPRTSSIVFSVDTGKKQTVDGLAQLSGTAEPGEVVITRLGKSEQIARFRVGKGNWKQGVPLAVGSHVITVKYIADRQNVGSRTVNQALTVLG